MAAAATALPEWLRAYRVDEAAAAARLTRQVAFLLQHKWLHNAPVVGFLAANLDRTLPSGWLEALAPLTHRELTALATAMPTDRAVCEWPEDLRVFLREAQAQRSTRWPVALPELPAFPRVLHQLKGQHGWRHGTQGQRHVLSMEKDGQSV